MASVNPRAVPILGRRLRTPLGLVMLVPLLIGLAGSLWAPSPAASAAVYNLIASADADVDSRRPGTNFGSETVLSPNASPVVRSYVRFQRQGLSGHVTRATLRVYSNARSQDGYWVRALANQGASWQELGISYATPLHSARLSDLPAGSMPVGGRRWT
jgi:hypothetical protein